MNINFEDYANFYDEIYSQKDYKGETEFILSLSEKFGIINPKSVLDIGCGTGGHMVNMVQQNIQVTGFDFSERMVKIAEKKLKGTGNAKRYSIKVGNAVDYRDGNLYDLVIAMFAVMGYLNTDDKFSDALKTVKKHLKPEGIFIFDVWFGPAVLNQMPETRIEEFIVKKHKFIKMAIPSIDVLNNVVDVSFKIIDITPNGMIRELNELHRMRYYFYHDLKRMLNNSGLNLIHICPFRDLDQYPTIADWNVTVVAALKNSSV